MTKRFYDCEELILRDHLQLWLLRTWW